MCEMCPTPEEEKAGLRVDLLTLHRIGNGCWFVIADSVFGVDPLAIVRYSQGQFVEQKIVASPCQPFSPTELSLLARRVRI